MREQVPEALAGQRVDRVVAMLTGLSRAAVAEMIQAGEITVGGVAVTTRSRKLHAGETVEVDVPDAVVAGALAGEASLDVPVVHVDDDVIVVDKPAGLVVHPGAGNPSGTMVHGLLDRFPELAGVGEADRPGVVHRLDKGTSGLLMVARTAVAYDSLVGQLRARTVERAYQALVWGVFESDRGIVDAPIGRAPSDRTRMTVTRDGREARTAYEVTRRWEEPGVTLLECRLETGRTHQIRVHLAAVGHPVVGDRRYRGSRPRVAIARPFLHAGTLGFDHPASGERLRFTSALPGDLVAVLDALG